MAHQQRKPYGCSRTVREQIFDQNHIANRLGHFGILNGNEAVVHPVFAIQLAVIRAGALSQFILMMGKIRS